MAIGDFKNVSVARNNMHSVQLLNAIVIIGGNRRHQPFIGDFRQWAVSPLKPAKARLAIFSDPLKLGHDFRESIGWDELIDVAARQLLTRHFLKLRAGKAELNAFYVLTVIVYFQYAYTAEQVRDILGVDTPSSWNTARLFFKTPAL